MNRLKLAKGRLEDIGMSAFRITSVTFFAIFLSYLLDSLCRCIDRTLTPNEEVPIFVINLDNVKDRMIFLDSQLDNYSKFSAVDWREISISEDEQILYDAPKRMTVTSFVEDRSETERYVAESLRFPDTKLRLKKKYFRKRDIGRFFSHVALWNECYKKAYDRILIFEDDIVLKPFFRTKLRRFLRKIPKDFDIAFLGYRDEFCWRSKKPLSRVGMHAYIINLKRKSLRSFIRDFYSALPIDFMVWMASKNLKCHFNKKQILAINEEFKSHNEFDANVVDPVDLKKYINEINEFFEIYFK